MSCHGDFDIENKEYFLEFENGNAELFKLSGAKLREMLRDESLNEIKLCFVNACHSEEVAKTFLDFGVTCIVVVSARHKINDSFAKEFSNLFYTELLEGRSIKQAFEKAKVQLKVMHFDEPDSCCCGHQHKDDCVWHQKVKTNGLNVSHYDHEPWCDCPKKDQHIHNSECDWADEFLMHFKARSIYTDESKKEIRVCCCSPELSHDEIMKLKMIFKDDDPRWGEAKILSGLRPGTVKQTNA